jgi:pimeloyl-ACP methyl ester carboxylesterase
VRTAPPTLYARTPRGDIAYQVAGDGPLNLLLVQGIGASIALLWDYQPYAAILDRLARFSRIILFDRRGSGISDPLPTAVPPTWEDWVDDIRAVLDDLGVTRASLVGERDATTAMTLFAASYPQRVDAMVLGHARARMRAAPDYPMGLSDERVEQLARFVEESWGTERFFSVFVPSLANNPEALQWLIKMNRIAYSPRRFGAEFRYLINMDVRSVLPTIRTPTLILQRSGYTLTPPDQARYLAQHLPNARLEILPGSDAMVFRPGDEQVLNLVEEFLTGARPATSDERVLATVMFTDIAQSTQMAAQLGDARWKELQTRHHEIVRQELTRFRGREVDTAGDGFLASFDGPARASRCAQAIQSELRQKLKLEIRAGLHTGECERLGDKLSGLAVHIGARIMNAARPGEVLASATVKDLVIGSGLSFRDAGVHSFKGVPGEWPLFALEG